MHRYLADLSMAVAEVELLYAVVYLLLSDDGERLAVGRVEAAVHERRVVVVEPVPHTTQCVSVHMSNQVTRPRTYNLLNEIVQPFGEDGFMSRKLSLAHLAFYSHKHCKYIKHCH